jgi:NTP pyrophosphatase (non-canonical NTP hydrolase)
VNLKSTFWGKSKAFVRGLSIKYKLVLVLILAMVKSMDLKEYQEKAKKTDLNTFVEKNNLDYYLLGLASEAGDVVGRMKYVYRDYGGKISAVEKEKIKRELGDVLWYVSAICDRMGFSLEEVAEMNIKKLSNRMLNDTLHGEDPNR